MLFFRCKLSADVVTQWYRNRACEMECLSKQVVILTFAIHVEYKGMYLGFKRTEFVVYIMFLHRVQYV